MDFRVGDIVTHNEYLNDYEYTLIEHNPSDPHKYFLFQWQNRRGETHTHWMSHDSMSYHRAG
jgi:hypothetical protein